MGVPRQYRTVGDNIIASFDQEDIASGTGYETYYGGMIASGATSTYRISNNEFWSDKVMTSGAIGVHDFTKVIDIDFDIDFRIPRNVKGVLIANVPTILFNYTAAGSGYFAYSGVKVRRVSGGSETEIAESSGAIWQSLAAGSVNGTDGDMSAIRVIIPETHFGHDDTLRLTVEVYGKGTGSANGTVSLGHDPKARTTSGRDKRTFPADTPSNLVFQVPFKIVL